MAVITTDAPVEPYEPDSNDLRPLELTGAEKTAFLEAFERTGSLRGSARAIDVPRNRVKVSRFRRPQFQNAVEAIRTRRLESAADELFWAIEAFAHLVGTDENALDELVNVYFNDTAELPRPLRRINGERLAAVRERLKSAGLAWAIAVVQVASADQDLAAAYDATTKRVA